MLFCFDGHIDLVTYDIAAAADTSKNRVARTKLYARMLRLGEWTQDDLIDDDVSRTMVSRLMSQAVHDGHVEVDEDAWPKEYELVNPDPFEREVRRLYQKAMRVYVEDFGVAAQTKIKESFQEAFPTVDFDTADSTADLSAAEMHDVCEVFFDD